MNFCSCFIQGNGVVLAGSGVGATHACVGASGCAASVAGVSSVGAGVACGGVCSGCGRLGFGVQSRVRACVGGSEAGSVCEGVSEVRGGCAVCGSTTSAGCECYAAQVGSGTGGAAVVVSAQCEPLFVKRCCAAGCCGWFEQCTWYSAGFAGGRLCHCDGVAVRRFERGVGFSAAHGGIALGGECSVGCGESTVEATAGGCGSGIRGFGASSSVRSKCAVTEGKCGFTGAVARVGESTSSSLGAGFQSGKFCGGDGVGDLFSGLGRRDESGEAARAFDGGSAARVVSCKEDSKYIGAIDGGTGGRETTAKSGQFAGAAVGVVADERGQDSQRGVAQVDRFVRVCGESEVGLDGSAVKVGRERVDVAKADVVDSDVGIGGQLPVRGKNYWKNQAKARARKVAKRLAATDGVKQRAMMDSWRRRPVESEVAVTRTAVEVEAAQTLAARRVAENRVAEALAAHKLRALRDKDRTAMVDRLAAARGEQRINEAKARSQASFKKCDESLKSLGSSGSAGEFALKQELKRAKDNEKTHEYVKQQLTLALKFVSAEGMRQLAELPAPVFDDEMDVFDGCPSDYDEDEQEAFFIDVNQRNADAFDREYSHA